jgi:hypothetical protein
MIHQTWPRLAATAVLAAMLSTLGTAAPAGAATTAGSVHPGSAVTLGDVNCEVGVALHQKGVVYVAIPASCAGPSPGQPQDGCTQAEAPIGSPAQIAGATHRGILVYNSFTRMQALGTKSSNRCAFNDLALIRLNHVDRRRVVGTVPGTRAPASVSSSGPQSGSSVTMGGSSATAEGTTAGGWAYQVRSTHSPTASDLGEPLVQANRVMGMLTVLPSVLPLRPNAEIANLHAALAFLRRTPGFHHVVLLRAGQRG